MNERFEAALSQIEHLYLQHAWRPKFFRWMLQHMTDLKRLLIFSDQGQSLTATLNQLSGFSPALMIEELLLGNHADVQAVTFPRTPQLKFAQSDFIAFDSPGGPELDSPALESNSPQHEPRHD